MNSDISTTVECLPLCEQAALENLFDSLPALLIRAGELAEASLILALRKPQDAWKSAVTPYVIAFMLGMDALKATPEKNLLALRSDLLSRLLSEQTALADSKDENFLGRFANLCSQLWDENEDEEYIRTVSGLLLGSQSREHCARIGRAIFLAGFWRGWKLGEHREGIHGSVN